MLLPRHKTFLKYFFNLAYSVIIFYVIAILWRILMKPWPLIAGARHRTMRCHPPVTRHRVTLRYFVTTHRSKQVIIWTIGRSCKSPFPLRTAQVEVYFNLFPEPNIFSVR